MDHDGWEISTQNAISFWMRNKPNMKNGNLQNIKPFHEYVECLSVESRVQHLQIV